ncbi:hypothetical protein [Streptomyces sp. HPF1205]|uniref:effector-associated constant component EACC1 n=1 Tax=Streptomyces sp. HPF1205 TaxID=2873262 RepID=UPI001CED52F7|nr:hypothetical protein [Streptomyces sp. HPF1205]
MFEPHISPRDEYESLLAMLRDGELATSTSVSVEDDVPDEAGNRPAILVTFTRPSGASFARALLGWLSERRRSPTRLVLTLSGGRTLELAVGHWTSAETTLALADFVEKEARRADPGDREDGPDDTPASGGIVKPKNKHTDTASPGVSVTNAPSPGSLTGLPSTVRNTPPGPPFGDEDDDEW